MKTLTNKGEKQNVIRNEIELGIEELEEKVAPGFGIVAPEPLDHMPLKPALPPVPLKPFPG